MKRALISFWLTFTFAAHAGALVVIDEGFEKYAVGSVLAGQGNWTQASGGESYAANVLAGFGSLDKQGWNVYGGFSY
ncbi:MAG: hypothetical protein QHI38_13630, partial [Armatimonadota bacterium]|nr:hypothetical protein [Armatimonadota bacterium]